MGIPPFRREFLRKPGRTLDEPIPRLLRHREPLRAQPVAQEVEAAIGAADEGLVGVLRKAEGGEGLVQMRRAPPASDRAFHNI